jgi:hypothetical protein
LPIVERAPALSTEHQVKLRRGAAMAKKAKAKKTAKKLPKSKGRFYEDPNLVRSKRDPNFKK